MTPSSPPSYTFLDRTPSPLLNTLASALIPPPTHETTQPNNTTIPNTDPNTPYGLTPQGPTPTDPSPSPQSTLPTLIAHNHASGPFTSAHRISQLPPQTFDFPNPQLNTETVHEPPRTHLMITRSQSGIVKPIDRLSIHTSSISHIPKYPSHALKDLNWRNAMYDEYNALVKNGTWLLIPSPAGVNMVRSMWLFEHKFHADGTLSRYKARLVANGSSQQLGVDFDETFSLVVKLATICTVLSLVVSRQWPIHQLDVKNAFLNGDLSETVYMHQPLGFVDNRYPHRVCLLQRSLYGLKQEPRAWFQRFAASYLALLQQIIGSLNNEFDMTDLGALNYFLGIFVDRTPTESKLGPEGAPVQDPTLYRSLVGGLQCLTFTRPDLSYAVQQICLYMHDPREPHLAALKRILRYVKGTLDLDIHLYASSTTSLIGYTDADWAGCPSTRSAEAEYRGVANVVAETAWLRNLLRELHSPLSTATLVYYDNVSAVYMSANPVQHQRTKHIEIDIHFVRDMVTAGQVRVLHVPYRFQYCL
ncbi:ribonuclease H-like domain-containing protein [Tanacetum coccineum]